MVSSTKIGIKLINSADNHAGLVSSRRFSVSFDQESIQIQYNLLGPLIFLCAKVRNAGEDH